MKPVRKYMYMRNVNQLFKSWQLFVWHCDLLYIQCNGVCATHNILFEKILWYVFQGIYQKAQALYYQGDFEMALVFYHRGHKLRPELQEFRLGIQKAQEAIDNSVGCKSTDIVFPNMVSYKMVVKSSKASAGSFQSLQQRKSDWTLDKVLTSHTSLSTSAPPVCSLPVSNNISSQKGKSIYTLWTLSFISHLKCVLTINFSFKFLESALQLWNWQSKKVNTHKFSATL